MAEKLALVDNYLSCHVCSETFRNPVTLSCHHSFCCDCLKTFWEQAKNNNCPICKRKHSKYERINFTLKELADSYAGRQKTETSEEKVKVLLCCEHPEEHQLFCEKEQRAVCRICDSSHHPGHKLVPIEQAVNKLKDQLKSDLRTLKDKRTKYKHFKTRYNNEVVPQNKKQVLATEKQIRAEFKKLHQILTEEEEARLAALREEEEQKEKIIQIIQEQISSLSDSISAVEQELQKHSVSFLSSYKHTQTSARVQCTLSDPQLDSGALIDVAKHLKNLSFTVWEKMKERVKFTPVILDPNTAAPWLCLSEDMTSVRWMPTKQQLPDNPERFSYSADVLGSEGFSSGKHSWEFEVGDHPNWTIGVAKESVDRKGKKYATPEYGLWCLWQKDGVYENGCGKTIPLQMNPERIRVQLDYDRGEVSFYDPEDMTLICTHKDTFTDKLYPYFSIGEAGDAETIDIKVCKVETCLSGMLSGTDTEVRGSEVKTKGSPQRKQKKCQQM